NCLVLRYEDMKLKPIETFTKAVKFLKIKADAKSIKSALAYSDIKRLQALEQQHGFQEKPPKTASFFRKGIVGDWKNNLTPNQINQIIQNHSEIMEAYDYL
ncbi:MAG: sulfotransferase domain-containing protein, partial [Legionella sp.]|nr:sulfotransferase domain-containing protein [Legionella sp.]